MEPHIVRAVDSERRSGSRSRRRCCAARSTPDIAATLTGMHGRRRRSAARPRRPQLDGYQVAGKTGTAHKVVDHHYSATDYNASFVGFVPSRAPAVRACSCSSTVRTPDELLRRFGLGADLQDASRKRRSRTWACCRRSIRRRRLVIDDDSRALAAAGAPRARRCLPTLALAGGAARDARRARARRARSGSRAQRRRPVRSRRRRRRRRPTRAGARRAHRRGRLERRRSAAGAGRRDDGAAR